MVTPATLLRAAKVRVTPARVRVLETLLGSTAPLSHADLEMQLPDADRVTLYRVLDSLVACGLALKAVDARGVFRFSASGSQREHKDHLHFRCVACGAVFCLDTSPPPPPDLPQGFRLNDAEYDLRGTCAQCSLRAE